MTVKLNDLAANRHLISAPGNFGAVAAYCDEYRNPGAPEAVIATMNAAMAQSLDEFYSPVFPRGARYNTAAEVREADLEVQHVRITPATDIDEPELIVSGHAGTRELLAERFPNATIVLGNATADQVAGKIVAGTLPPHLAVATKAYAYVSVDGFDYAKDGDLSGDELRKRLIVNPAVSVTVQ